MAYRVDLPFVELSFYARFDQTDTPSVLRLNCAAIHLIPVVESDVVSYASKTRESKIRVAYDYEIELLPFRNFDAANWQDTDDKMLLVELVATKPHIKVTECTLKRWSATGITAARNELLNRAMYVNGLSSSMAKETGSETVTLTLSRRTRLA